MHWGTSSESEAVYTGKNVETFCASRDLHSR